jgi:hypothetical protein
MTDAVGPIFAAGFQHITESGYEILYLPDLHNDELQREGKAPVYWWLPNTVRLARKDGDTGDYKFNMIHFVGVRSQGTTVGAQGDEEVSGGLLGFSTTSAPPAAALQQSQDALLNRFRGNDDKYWGWRTPVAPMFRPAPIVSNTTTITNLSPNPDGSVPAVTPSSGGATPAPAPAGPAPAPPGVGGAPPRARGLNGSRPPMLQPAFQAPMFRSPPTFPLQRAYRGSNLDMWYANLQGQGQGSVSPFAENAYSGLLGSMPAALVWASFHGGTGGISVWQQMNIKVWSPVIRLVLDGEWSRIQDHFSAAAHGGGWFWSADIQAEFNSMRVNGDITVKVEVDTTLPNADKLQEEMNKRSDLVFQKFMDQAQKMIFDPPAFNEKPAEASGGFLGFGGGVALKLRRDKVNLHLHYEETREMAYLQPYPISGQLEGFYDVIKDDPTQEKKYFTTLYLDDWDRKVSRTIKPVVNWPDPGRQWVGEPVAFVSAMIGYPNTDGAIQWDGHVFQSNDGPNAVWNTAAAMKKASDVTNAPSGWTPDKTFVKRQVHFTEPPSDADNPFVRVQIEKNVVDLDPGDYGSLLNDINLEVRVDNVGGLTVGPMFLDVDLENAKQIVEVTFQALGNTDDGSTRPPVKFSWQSTDQTEPRYWMLFTGQPTFVPRFQYQVRVIVKGSIFTAGMDWIGEWQDASSSGPLMIKVPQPDDPGVTTRELPFSAVAGAPASTPGGNGARPPVHAPAPTHPPVVAGGRSTTPPIVRPRDMPPAAADAPRAEGWVLTRAREIANAASRGMPGEAHGNGVTAEEPMFEGYVTTRPADAP